MRSLLLAIALTVIVATPGVSQTPRTYANPIDIDYRYNFEQLNQGISYRSGADPVIVVQRGKYYLFETIGDGYWESTDLGAWRHITPSRWPLTDVVAPAVLSVRDTIYLLPSTTSPLPILMLTEPASGRVEFYNRLLPWLPMARFRETDVLAKPDSVQPGPWDPQFFDPMVASWLAGDLFGKRAGRATVADAVGRVMLRLLPEGPKAGARPAQPPMVRSVGQ